MQGLSEIAIFAAVVETHSFSRAAEALGISKSAVSKRVTGLEKRLGVRLLHRTTRRLSLTEAGRHFFANATKALHYVNAAEDAATGLQKEPKGQLRIHVPMSFGRLHVAPLIPAFLCRYPQLQVDLVMGDRVIDLVDAGYDVALRTGNPPDSTMITRKLAPLRSVICATPGYIKLNSAPKKPTDLQQHNCILFSQSDNADIWQFKGTERNEEIQISSSYRVNNGEAVCQALLQGLGIGRLPTFIAGPMVASGQLVQLLSTFEMPAKTLYAAFPERQYMPAKLRAFLDFAVAELGQHPPYWDKNF